MAARRESMSILLAGLILMNAGTILATESPDSSTDDSNILCEQFFAR